MMNLIALSLITTSFVVSGLFSPTPHRIDPTKEQVIVREGHRAVVVEYADAAGEGNTKVSISPPQPTTSTAPDEDQLSMNAASMSGVTQDVTEKAKEVVTGGSKPREILCDAYGRCKHKVAGVLSRAKDKVAGVENVVEETVDKAKDFASRTTHKAGETVEDVKEMAKDKAHEAKSFALRTGNKVGETAEDAKDMAKDKAKEAKDFASRATRKAGVKVEDVKEMAMDKAKETGEMAKETGRKGKEEFSDIVKRSKKVAYDVFGPDSMGPVLNLLGFTMAYGIGTWVTFVMSYLLAGMLSRQQFGMVQSKMYPVYIKAMATSIGFALLGHLLGNWGKVFKNLPEVLQGCNLLSSLLFVLVNLLFLEPRATRVLFERLKLEKEEGRGREDHAGAPTRVIDTVVAESAGPLPTTADVTTTNSTTTQRREQDVIKNKLSKLDEKLRKLNSYSSLLNTMTLMGLTWHLVYLSQRLRINGCDTRYGTY